jgi:hypothetical protein
VRLAFIGRRDPFWGVDGSTVRRRRTRTRVISMLAAAIAVLAVLAVGIVGALGVRAAGLSVNLDQWASTDAAWQNGNLNGNNSRYPEGGIIPFRLAVEGLAAGDHSIVISYDFTASGHKAYDFLATWNATNGPPICGVGGGGRSSMCPTLPASSSFAFPSDPFSANGLSVTGAQVYSGAGRRLTIWGGSIRGITGPRHDGSVNGNSTAEFTVRFRSTGAAVLLAWGGHLAQSRYWDVVAGGARDGASMVSGAPWHMRTLNLDGGGARNQDRSIQPSAVVGELPPFALSPTPTPRPNPPAAPGPTPAVGNPGPPQGGGPTVPPTATEAPATTVPSTFSAGVMLVALLLTSAITLRLSRRPRRRPR